jgi:hypothetical protein
VTRVLRWCTASSLLLAGLVPAGSAQGVVTGTPAVPPSAARVSPDPTVHSSDGVRGPRLPSAGAGARLLAELQGGSASQRTVGTTWQVAPGLEFSQWTQTEVQGPVRVFLLTARLDEPGLVLDQVSGTTVRSRAPLSRLLRADRAVAGVNADFFDIGDTGAPLGPGVDRQQGLLHAPRSGWNASFVIDARGNARVLQDRLVAQVVRRGQVLFGIHNLNSPEVARNGIGLYTAAWGQTLGRRVVDRTGRVRQVLIRGGVVRSNRTTLSARTSINGDLLIGRGTGADKLETLRVGQRVSIRRDLTVPAEVAVSGSVQLLRAGVPTTRQNTELHPRTAVGVDRDRRLVHLLVADGRTRSSRGLTLLQLARLMRSFGDDEALNLDGGGSSTMVARNAAGVVGVRNRPSDGRERYVPNGLGFRYTAPKPPEPPTPPSTPTPTPPPTTTPPPVTEPPVEPAAP